MPAAIVPHSSAVAAQNKIHATLLALARSIRKPRSYVGYSAFILMGLLKKCRPCVWEGPQCVDLLQEFAPWAIEDCKKQCPVHAIPCVLIAKPGGAVHCAPISEEHPLARVGHYVGGAQVPASAVAEETQDFELLYASLGIATLPTVMDGDCGLDVMNMMLAQPSTFDSRKQLRIELSDYLISRIGEPWMLELMVACQELESTDLAAASTHIFVPSGAVAPPAVAAAPAVADKPEETFETVPQETFEAIRWASNLQDAANVLSLCRSLPGEIIQEQLRLYRNREAQPAVADIPQPIVIDHKTRYHERMLVAARFHKYCKSHGIVVDQRLPHGAITSFIRDHIVWKAKTKKLARQQISAWYRAWNSQGSNVVPVEEGVPKAPSQKSLLKSRAPVPNCRRKRAHGGGRHSKAPLIRQQL